MSALQNYLYAKRADYKRTAPSLADQIAVLADQIREDGEMGRARESTLMALRAKTELLVRMGLTLGELGTVDALARQDSAELDGGGR